MTWPLQKVCTLTAQLLASDENWCLRILVCFSWSVEMDSISKWKSTILEEHRQVWEFQLSSSPKKSMKLSPPKNVFVVGTFPKGREDPVDHASFIASGIGVHANLAWRCGVFQRKRWISKRQISMRGDVMKGDVIMNPGTFRVRQFCENSGYLERSWQNNRSSQCHDIGLRIKLITFRDGNGCPLHLLEDGKSIDGDVPKQISNHVVCERCIFEGLALYLSFCIFVPKRRNGCFRKSGYPQIIHFNRIFQYKPSIFGVPLLLETPK